MSGNFLEFLGAIVVYLYKVSAAVIQKQKLPGLKTMFSMVGNFPLKTIGLIFIVGLMLLIAILKNV